MQSVDERERARSLMRRGMQPDQALWMARTESLSLLRWCLDWGLKAPRFRGTHKVARLLVLRAGCTWLRLHRWAWVRGLVR